MGYPRRISNYLEKIAQYDPTSIMNMVDPVVVSVETPRIDSRYPLERVHIIDPYESLNGI